MLKLNENFFFYLEKKKKLKFRYVMNFCSDLNSVNIRVYKLVSNFVLQKYKYKDIL